MKEGMGASAKADRATAVEPVPVSPLRDGIPSALRRVAVVLAVIFVLAFCGKVMLIWGIVSRETIDWSRGFLTAWIVLWAYGAMRWPAWLENNDGMATD